MKRKVLAYIISPRNGLDLLVHEHRDLPEAGIQVPAGTVEENEPVEKALFREIEEETGITGLKLIKKLEIYHYFNEFRNEMQERHVFLLEMMDESLERWEHIVSGGGEDEGMVFSCYWMPLVNLDLSWEMGKSIHLIWGGNVEA